jgi:hypothetical protein
MESHNCIGSACAICHPRCECHECTQIRGRELNPFQNLQQYFDSQLCPFCKNYIPCGKNHTEGGTDLQQTKGVIP